MPPLTSSRRFDDDPHRCQNTTPTTVISSEMPSRCNPTPSLAEVGGPMGKVLKFSGFRPFVPAWVEELHLLLLHPLPQWFSTELAEALGIDEYDPAIGHAAALSRIFGLRAKDLAELFNEIGRHFGDTRLVCRAVGRVARLTDGCSPPGASTFLRKVWGAEQVYGQAAMAALDRCGEIIMKSRAEGWRPFNSLMGHLALLIEATRLERIHPSHGWRP